MVFPLSKHWTERMFIEKPSLFGASLEKAMERASSEVTGLEKIFSQFGVSGNGLVLDLCCGIGRHSILLAERCYRVIGVDLSPQYISRASEVSVQRGVAEKVEFRIGDMRQVANVLRDYKGKLNAAINLFSSIGYYDDETDREVLTQVSSLMAPQGVLIIETKNRDWLIRHFLRRGIEHIDDDLVLIEERKLNLENSRMENVWKYYRRQGQNLEYLDSFAVNHRVYSFHELKNLVESSGWTYQTCYDGFNLEPVKMDSNRMILVAKIAI